MNDSGYDGDADKRRHHDRGHLHQQVNRDEHRNDGAADVSREDGRAGDVARRHPIANAETANDSGGMRLAGRDARDRNIDVAADETDEQRRKRQLRRQSERDESVVDDVDFDQDEKEREDEKEDDRVEGEERCEQHRAILAMAQAWEKPAARAERVSVAPARRVQPSARSTRPPVETHAEKRSPPLRTTR